jgi:hypothetical protein
MAHPDELPDDSTDHASRIRRDKEVHAAALMRESPRKPSNWWAFEREPWKRVNAEILARETAGSRQGKGRPRAQERICLCRRRAGDGQRSRRAGGGECSLACAGRPGMMARRRLAGVGDAACETRARASHGPRSRDIGYGRCAATGQPQEQTGAGYAARVVIGCVCYQSSKIFWSGGIGGCCRPSGIKGSSRYSSSLTNHALRRKVPRWGRDPRRSQQARSLWLTDVLTGAALHLLSTADSRGSLWRSVNSPPAAPDSLRRLSKFPALCDREFAASL